MERNATFLCVFILFSCLGRFYIAKMLGHKDPYELFTTDELPSSYTDTLFVLQLLMVLMMSHACPLRWCSLLAIEIATPIVYGVPTFLSWSPEPKKLTCFLNLLMLVCFSAYAKRQMEVSDRLVFSALLNEKTLRVQAEFLLSKKEQKDKGDDAESTCAISLPETATTDEAFNRLDPEEDHLPSSLPAVFSIGKREQWLIDEKELVVNPEACLGMGGFGIVLEGEFNSSPAAFKILKSNSMNKSLHAMGNELRLLRKLRHSNIVLFHGACLNLAQNDIVLVMERVIGISMTKFIIGKPSVTEVHISLSGICHGLIHLHTRWPAIAHGDLKPANIMIEQRGSQPHAKILDFGLARLITNRARSGGGTRRWMAPEMLKSNSRPAVSSDVFALGLIIYFASTGKTPFEELSLKGLMSHARTDIATDSALIWPAESSELAANCKPIVDLATRRLPQERPTVHDVYRMISKIAPSDAVSSKVGRCASDLWGSLLIARNAAAAKGKSQQFKFWRWFEKVKFAEELASPSNLEPIREEDEVTEATDVPASSETVALMYPGFMVTSTEFMKISLISNLVSWNCVLPRASCCQYHGILSALSSLHQELHGYACKQLVDPGSRFEQCPVCSLVSPKENDDSVVEEMSCSLCGFEGLPRQCETPQSSHQTINTPDSASPLTVSL